MNAAAIQRFRANLAAGEPVFGLWVTLDSASITEIAVALDLDWVCIDAEHGHLDWHEIVNHLRAGVRSETVILVRIAENSGVLTKRALDIGADGIIVPSIQTVEQLKEAVSFAHYPPAGSRGVGAERATRWGQCMAQHVEEAEANVLVVPIVESVTGGRNIRELVEIPNVDTFFFGPADYSASAGYPGEWEGPGVADQIQAAVRVIRQAGKYCGVVADSVDGAKRRLEEGFQVIGLGLDAGLLMGVLRERLRALARKSHYRA